MSGERSQKRDIVLVVDDTVITGSRVSVPV